MTLGTEEQRTRLREKKILRFIDDDNVFNNIKESVSQAYMEAYLMEHDMEQETINIMLYAPAIKDTSAEQAPQYYKDRVIQGIKESHDGGGRKKKSKKRKSKKRKSKKRKSKKRKSKKRSRTTKRK
jgi:hypothetical protein